MKNAAGKYDETSPSRSVKDYTTTFGTSLRPAPVEYTTVVTRVSHDLNDIRRSVERRSSQNVQTQNGIRRSPENIKPDVHFLPGTQPREYEISKKKEKFPQTYVVLYASLLENPGRPLGHAARTA